MNLEDYKKNLDAALTNMSDEEIDRFFGEDYIEPEKPIDARDIRLAEFKIVVTSLLNDLPEKRDWLDPMLEKAMRSLVND